YTIPLRDRKDDIEILMMYYLKRQNLFIELEEFIEVEVLEFLKIYNWPGNIRELVNIMEYLVNIKEFNIKIKLDDLPKYILKTYGYNINEVIKNNKEENNSNTYELKSLNSIYDDKFENILSEEDLWILEKIYENKGIGRRMLSKISEKEGNKIGEGRLRGIMNRLRDRNLIEINRGLKGSNITDEGINIIRKG
ncbi:MAG: hypothetical protein ACRC1Y_01845, partial [Paraclostridium sp.]